MFESHLSKLSDVFANLTKQTFKKRILFELCQTNKGLWGLKSNAHSQKTQNKSTGLKGLTTCYPANTNKEYLCKH